MKNAKHKFVEPPSSSVPTNKPQIQILCELQINHK